MIFSREMRVQKIVVKILFGYFQTAKPMGKLSEALLQAYRFLSYVSVLALALTLVVMASLCLESQTATIHG